MKVVFMEEVEGTARVGEVKNVADGFARNYLLPRRLAAPANDHYIAIAQARAEKEARHQEREDEEALAHLVPKMEGRSVTIEVRVGEQGKLFGSVTARDIARALQEDTGVELEHRQVDLRQPIREVGSQEVTVNLTRNVHVQVNVSVEPLGGMPETEAEAATEGPEAEAETEAVTDEPEAEARAEAEAEMEEPEAEAEAVLEEEPEAEEEQEVAAEEEPEAEEREAEDEPESEPAVEEAEGEVEAGAEAEARMEEPEAEAETEAVAEEPEVEDEPEAEPAVEEAEGEVEAEPAVEEAEGEVEAEPEAEAGAGETDEET